MPKPLSALAWTPADRVERCRLDAWAAYLIAKEEYPKLDSLLYEFTSRVAFGLHRLHLAGAIVDLKRFNITRGNVESELLRITDRLSKVANIYNTTVSDLTSNTTEGSITTVKGSNSIEAVEPFTPSNDNHIRKLLFEKLKLPVLNRTKKTKYPQVTRDTLKALQERIGEQDERYLVLQGLIDYSIVHKIYSTYVEGLEALIVPVGKLSDGSLIGWLPFRFNPLGARTGRASSSQPNSQNWPTGARQIIRSRWVGGSILEADYSKIEPIIIAWLAGDEKLLEFFSRGNGYIDVARELFKKDVRAGTPLYRAVKSIVLGVHYDMQTELMAQQLWKEGIRFGDWTQHYRITNEIRQTYLGIFPNIGRYMDSRREERVRTGQVLTATGRVRRLPGGGKHTDNQAINFPVQSLAADICGAAILDVERALLGEYHLSLVEWYQLLMAQRKIFLDNHCEMGYNIPTMFNTVHDSLLTDVPPGQEVRAKELLVETMTTVPTFRALVPSFDIALKVDIKISPVWGAK